MAKALILRGAAHGGACDIERGDVAAIVCVPSYYFGDVDLSAAI